MSKMPSSIANSSLKLYVVVGIGGSIGASLRYLISVLFAYQSVDVFPWATLFVNVVGAFVLSYLLFHPFIKEKIGQPIFTALTTGVIGSFTTFSTITVEVVSLWEKQIMVAIFYSILTFIIGLLACLLAYVMVRRRGRWGS